MIAFQTGFQLNRYRITFLGLCSDVQYDYRFAFTPILDWCFIDIICIDLYFLVSKHEFHIR